MIKAKVLEILKTFSKDETKRFTEFISSSYFNKKELVVKLFGIYQNYHPNFDDENFTKEIVFKKLFPDREYNDEVFRNLNSDLYKLAESFLSLLNYSADQIPYYRHLLQELNKRSLFNLFNGSYEKALNNLESDKLDFSQYFIEKYFLQTEKEINNALTYSFSDENLREYEVSLINLFLSHLLDIHTYIFNTCKVKGINYQVVFSQNLLSDLFSTFQQDIKENPRIQILYHLCEMIEKNESHNYYSLKKLLEEYSHLIKDEQLWQVYNAMINYIRCIDLKLDFKLEYVEDSFELRKKIIEKSLIPSSAYIEHNFFKSLVRSGLRLNKFDWIYNFITRFGKRLNPVYRESTVELSFGMYYFYKEEYSKSLSHLSKVKYEEDTFNLEVKNLNARIYYETKQFDLLENLIPAYAMFLSKSKRTLKPREESHRDFVNHFVKLIKIRQGNKFYKLNSLKKQIQSKEFIEKNWLLEKIDELNPKILKNIKAK